MRGLDRLKALVMDSVYAPITERVYNLLGLDELLAWYELEPRPGFTKATVSAWRVALRACGLGSVSINVADHRRAQAGCPGRRQRTAVAEGGCRHLAPEGHQVPKAYPSGPGCPPAGPEVRERAGRLH
jgi:hypothetical protein